jgi:hypothetical protein
MLLSPEVYLVAFVIGLVLLLRLRYKRRQLSRVAKVAREASDNVVADSFVATEPEPVPAAQEVEVLYGRTVRYGKQDSLLNYAFCCCCGYMVFAFTLRVVTQMLPLELVQRFDRPRDVVWNTENVCSAKLCPKCRQLLRDTGTIKYSVDDTQAFFSP